MAESDPCSSAYSGQNELQKRIFGSRLRERILACRAGLIGLVGARTSDEYDPNDNGYDTDPEDPGEECEDAPGGLLWASAEFVKFCKGNTEYPQRGGEFPASRALQNAIRDFFSGWSSSQIRCHELAYSLDGINSHFLEDVVLQWSEDFMPLSRLAPIVEECFLFYIYILMPSYIRRLNEELGRNPQSTLQPEQKTWRNFATDSEFLRQWIKFFDNGLAAREKAKLLRNEQIHIMEAYVRSRLWAMWKDILAGEDVSRTYIMVEKSPYTRIGKSLFAPGLDYMVAIRSERLETLLLRYLQDDEVNLGVLEGLDAAEATFCKSRVDCRLQLDAISRSLRSSTDWAGMEETDWKGLKERVSGLQRKVVPMKCLAASRVLNLEKKFRNELAKIATLSFRILDRGVDSERADRMMYSSLTAMAIEFALLCSKI
ncbi:hypothetical protein BJ508DRAFT_356717 [Ascobolus immersus RN42]|uniref:Uncharacterized protein n=1 Tax=Ascobolus immersus RN42 TaxID=1160509 RepID=A0A3N4IQA6_ASCIM|nr:hypothetical protein BJ508DRAFT_356717 [Ascobolus immersus RN42]